MQKFCASLKIGQYFLMITLLVLDSVCSWDNSTKEKATADCLAGPCLDFLLGMNMKDRVLELS